MVEGGSRARHDGLGVGTSSVNRRSAETPVPSCRDRRQGAAIGLAPIFRAVPGALQQRVALELPLHIGGKIEIGELQQLDGLHQLRRHYQRVALPNLETLSERHDFPADWSNSCLSASRPDV